MRRLLLLLLGALSIAACDDDPTSFDESIGGTYHLRQINSDTLPITFFVDPETDETVAIMGAELLIGINGSFREIDTFRRTLGSTVTTQVDTFTGTWTIAANNTMSFTAQDEDGPFTISGTWDGSRQITQTSSGITFVWRR